MYKVTVYVTYKDSVLDPQGEAVKGAVHRMGYESIENIRIGKYFEIQVSKTERNPAGKNRHVGETARSKSFTAKTIRN